MAWLANYTKRIKLSVDNTKIDAALSNFPTTVFFTSTQGEEIFTEFDADSDYMKCAFTLSNGTTQLYAEKELFDHSASKAIYHVKVTSISSSAGTDIYYYYNNSGSDNITYISTINYKGYPPAHSDTYVKATSSVSANYVAYYATDPALSLTGGYSDTTWLGSATTNQRFHIDLGSAKIVKKIYYENVHSSGSETDMGANNFTFWGSNTGAGSFDDLVYANDEGWTQLTTSQSTFDIHTGSDVADPKYITVTNTTAYRYYAFKIADNHGDGSFLGLRHVELWISNSSTNVWDSDFKTVHHMVDDTTSMIMDSTTNNNDGTKGGAATPNEATGKVGQAQEFDGSERVDLQLAADLGDDPTYTLEAIFKTTDKTTSQMIYCQGSTASGTQIVSLYVTASAVKLFHRDDSNTSALLGSAINDATYYHVAGVRSASNAFEIFVNGATQDTDSTSIGATTINKEKIGEFANSAALQMLGIVDELRISDIVRSDAWIKATYNTLWDSLLTYGSQETSGIADNAMFFGTNF